MCVYQHTCTEREREKERNTAVQKFERNTLTISRNWYHFQEIGTNFNNW